MALLVSGAIQNIDARDGNAATALHIATEQNDLVGVKLLVNAGAALDLNDYETPLHCAVRMDHTEIVRYLIQSGASLVTNNLESVNAFDLSMRKIVGNDRFAAGILRPLTVEIKEVDYDGTTRSGKKRKTKKKKNKNKNTVLQDYEKMRSMASWDHGEKLVHDIAIHRTNKQGAQKLSRLVLKEDLQEAKAMVGDYGISCNKPDPDDYGRSAVTYAAMYSNQSTVRWLVQEAGARPTTKDGLISGKSKSFLNNWSNHYASLLKTKEEQVRLEYARATQLREYEANAKQGLDFLRHFLQQGKVRYGGNFRSRLILSLRALEKCPLGPADDFVEMGRLLRSLLPNSWGSEAWQAFQDATIAARSKENMRRTFGGSSGGGGQLIQLQQQGTQGEIFKPPAAMQAATSTITTSPLRSRNKYLVPHRARAKRMLAAPPPPPPRDYSCLVTGSRYDKEYVPGI